MANTRHRQPATLGDRIRMVRRTRRLTQRQVARKTGMAEPFLSRVENGRAQPSLQTIERLAAALDVTIGDLLAVDPGNFKPSCPVTQSGRCIAELIYHPGPGGHWPQERYTSRQIALLRLSNYLVQFGSAETLTALETVMRGMLKLPSTRRNRRWLRALKARGPSSATGRSAAIS